MDNMNKRSIKSALASMNVRHPHELSDEEYNELKQALLKKINIYAISSIILSTIAIIISLAAIIVKSYFR